MAEDTAAVIPLPNDAGHHDDGRLLHDLAALNTEIARYLFRYMDADAGRGEPVAVDDERRLAEELSKLAERLRGRADQRAGLCPSPVIITDADTGP